MFGPNTIIVFLSLYWFARMTQRRRKRDRDRRRKKEKETRNKKETALSWPTIHSRNRCRRRNEKMLIFPCTGWVSNVGRRVEEEEGRARRTQKYKKGDLVIFTGLVKSHPQSELTINRA